MNHFKHLAIAALLLINFYIILINYLQKKLFAAFFVIGTKFPTT